MQLTVAVSAVLDRLRAVLTRHSDAPVAPLLPRETFLLTDWGRHRRQQPEEYSVRTLPYASTVIDSTMPTDRHLARPHEPQTTVEPARAAEASCVVVEASALLGTGPPALLGRAPRHLRRDTPLQRKEIPTLDHPTPAAAAAALVNPSYT